VRGRKCDFTFSSSYLWLATGRLISGFRTSHFWRRGDHSSKIAPPGKVTIAVAGMIAGMTVANLVGVPLGTWLGHEFNWRYTFMLIAIFDALVIFSVLMWVPKIHDKSETKLTEQFHFLTKPEPWLIFAATMFGNAGVFAWFSFVKPFMVNVSGFSEGVMTVIMMLMGLGMVLGNLLSGKLSGRFSPLRIAATTDLVIVASLLSFSPLANRKPPHW
jgi:DHA1 family arabinose polymer transporter-like MFS transporter